MQFTVTYRDKTGRVRDEVFDAASRSVLFGQLKKGGITPIKVLEGAKAAKPTRAVATPSPAPRAPFRWIVLVALGVAAVGVCVWIVFKPGAVSVKPTPPAKVEVPKVKPSAPKPMEVLATNAVPKPVVKRKPFKAKAQPVKTAEIEPPEIQQEKLLEFYHAINPRLVRDHELFKHDSDIMIADVLTARPGERLIGLELDRNFDKNFAASLTEPIAPHEKDTDEDKMVKDAVMKARQTLAAQMAAGESPAQIIQQARDDLNKIADYRDLLERELHKAAETEDEQYLDDFVAEANKMLDEYGAFHLKLGKKMRAKVRARMEQAGSMQNNEAASGEIK